MILCLCVLQWRDIFRLPSFYMYLHACVLRSVVMCSASRSNDDCMATDPDVEAAIMKSHELEFDWRNAYRTSQTFKFVCDARRTPQARRRRA
jgi:hypothetical protein